jgi:hypothetical protein
MKEVAMKRQWMGILALAVCAGAATTALAHEQATDAERSWRDLRDSRDVRTKLLAERWYSVVRTQDWTNDTGQFKTSAKYVEHDPNLGWVKLRMVQGTGRDRVVKDVTIPLSKLSKTCQSRVRQINTLTERVDVAKVEEEKRLAEAKKDAPAGEAGAGPEAVAVAGEMPVDAPRTRDAGTDFRRERELRRVAASKAGKSVAKNPLPAAPSRPPILASPAPTDTLTADDSQR